MQLFLIFHVGQEQIQFHQHFQMMVCLFGKDFWDAVNAADDWAHFLSGLLTLNVPQKNWGTCIMELKCSSVMARLT